MLLHLQLLYIDDKILSCWQPGLGLLNDFRKFDYRNLLLFSFSIYRNRISFPILRCATVLTYRGRPFTALAYRRIRSAPIRSVIIISSNLTPRVKQADGSHWQTVRTKWGQRRREQTLIALSPSPHDHSLYWHRAYSASELWVSDFNSWCVAFSSHVGDTVSVCQLISWTTT